MLFSIILPTYNRIDYLKQSVNSVLEQTYRNLELIIVDNYSDDGTIDWLNTLTDPRIRVVSLERTGIIARSRNLGISLASGEWICFLDSDDFWEINKLETLYGNIKKHQDISVICHAEKIVKNDGTVIKEKFYRGKYNNMLKGMLIFGNSLSTSATAIKSSLVVQHKILFDERPAFNSVEDYDLWLQIAKISNNFLFLNHVLGAYRIHDGGISTNINTHYQNMKNVVEYRTNDIENSGAILKIISLLRIDLRLTVEFLSNRKILMSIYSFRILSLFTLPILIFKYLKK